MARFLHGGGRNQGGVRLAVAIALFFAGIAMGIAGAFVWAWAVHAGQLRDLEATKLQLFWPDLAPESGERASEPEPQPARADGR